MKITCLLLLTAFIVLSGCQYRKGNLSIDDKTDRYAGIGFASVSLAQQKLLQRKDIVTSDEQGWTVIEIPGEHTVWSFTHDNFLAHPSAIKRVIAERNGQVYIDMRILCEAEKTDCIRLIEEFELLNKGVRRSMNLRRY